jgi:xylulokinase
LCEIAPAILGVPVVIPDPGEYVAEGACRQAAWTLLGDEHPPVWTKPEEKRFEAAPAPQVRERYASLRELTEGV